MQRAVRDETGNKRDEKREKRAENREIAAENRKKTDNISIVKGHLHLRYIQENISFPFSN